MKHLLCWITHKPQETMFFRKLWTQTTTPAGSAHEAMWPSQWGASNHCQAVMNIINTWYKRSSVAAVMCRFLIYVPLRAWRLESDFFFVVENHPGGVSVRSSQEAEDGWTTPHPQDGCKRSQTLVFTMLLCSCGVVFVHWMYNNKCTIWQKYHQQGVGRTN